MRYVVSHTVAHRYRDTATTCLSQIHLLPRAAPGQRILSATASVEPTPDDWSESTDEFGNRRVHFAVERPHEELVIQVLSVFDVDKVESTSAGQIAWEAARDGEVSVEHSVFCLPSPALHHVDELVAVVAPAFVEGSSLREAIGSLTDRIDDRWTAVDGPQETPTPWAQLIAGSRAGTLDRTHLLLAGMRSVGIPCRFVRGYRQGLTHMDQWAEVRAEPAVWVDVATLVADHSGSDAVHRPRPLTVAWGRDHHDVVPVRSVVIGADPATDTVVQVDVTAMDAEG